jgi:nicotinamidase-related amidase
VHDRPDPTRRALIVIDLQNDYFPGGQFPLWNIDAIPVNIEAAIGRARAQHVPVIVLQYVAARAERLRPSSMRARSVRRFTRGSWQPRRTPSS